MTWVLVIALLSHNASGDVTRLQAVMTQDGYASSSECYQAGKAWVREHDYDFARGTDIICTPSKK